MTRYQSLRSKSIGPSGVLLAGVLFWTGAAGTEGHAWMQVPVPQHDVSVSLKLVFVRVTDKHGRPIPGLKTADFELRDNGKIQKITDFEAFYEAAPAPSPAVSTGAETSAAKNPLPTPDPRRPPIAPGARPESAPLKLFLLIDEDNNDLSGLQKSRALAVRILRTQLKPGDSAAVLTWSTWTGLKVQLHLTTDLGKAAAVIDGMKLIPGRDIDDTYNATEETSIFKSLAYRDSPLEMRIKAKHFSQRMAEWSKYLREIPGRKNLIIFSWGAPRSLFKRFDVRKDLEVMARGMATAQTPVISINSERIKSGSEKQNEVLQYIAEETGGKAFASPGAVSLTKAIDRTVRDFTRCYYVLGYPIQAEWDGRFHRISIAVKKPGLTVNTQSGYLDSRPVR